jgi:uncharacterized membrane protein
MEHIRGCYSCCVLVLLGGLLMPFAASGGDRPGQADFHAVGHQPGWQLDIDYENRQLNFTAEEGSGTYRYVKLSPDLRRGNIKAVTYRVVDDNHRMNVVVLEMFCQDSQSGKAYGATVNVHLDGREYTGCGEPVVERSLDAW